MSAALKLVEKEGMENKNKALDAALAQIERAFGKGSIMKLGQREALEIEAISTGSLGLDIALGIGGLPKGRIVEIYGPESSGKTTLALHVVAEAQKKGGACAFVDAEHALDPAYAKKLGVDIDNLLISQPDAGEQALEIADTLVRSGAIDVLVIDSDAQASVSAMLMTTSTLFKLQQDGLTIVDYLVKTVLSDENVDWPQFVVRDLSDIDYYVAFGCWRLAVISEGVYARYLHGAMGQQDGVDLDTFKLGTENLAERALAAMRRLT